MLGAPATDLLPCLRCVRTAYKGAGPSDVVPPCVDCQFVEPGSSRCRQCNKRKDNGCNPVGDSRCCAPGWPAIEDKSGGGFADD